MDSPDISMLSINRCATGGRPLVNITLPVLNEEKLLAVSIPRLTAFCSDHAEYVYEIVIVNNGSTDRTQAVAEELCQSHRCMRVLTLEKRGRGRALREAWTTSSANLLCYMDIDLSTDLGCFPSLIGGLVSGNYDLAIGSRLLPGAHTTRCLRREAISRFSNFLCKMIFQNRFSDAQCGFKAITRSAAVENRF